MAAWTADDGLSDQSRLRLGELIRRFTRRLAASGLDSWEQVSAQDAEGFVMAPTRSGSAPSTATMYVRRTAVRRLFLTLAELGAPVSDPTWQLTLPTRGPGPCRPLTDGEVALVRASTRLGASQQQSLRRAVVFALAEATAVTGEISAVRLGDLDDPVDPRSVWLAGTVRHDARVGLLTTWGRAVVARHVAALAERDVTDSAVLLTYSGRGVPGQHVAQAAICNALSELMAGAGIPRDRLVRPGSVRAWAGRSLFEAGAPIEEVARRLGCRSLDAAAEDIGLTWRVQAS